MRLDVLWLARTVPLPLKTGDNIYTYRLARALSDAGANVTFVGLRPEQPFECESHGSIRWRIVDGAPRSRHLSLISRYPLVAARHATAAYRRTLATMPVEEFDVVILDQYGMCWAKPYVEGRMLVHVAHDFETDLNWQLATHEGSVLRKAHHLQNAIKTAAAERSLALASHGVIALTERDAASFRAINPALDTIVLPPGHDGARQGKRTISTSTPRRVLILGSFVWAAKQLNLEGFLDEAAAHLAASGVQCWVVGMAPADVLARWRERYPQIVFTGFVEDVQEILNNSRIGLVIDKVGGGFKLKTLDYIFARLPVAGFGRALEGIPQELLDAVWSVNDTAEMVRLIDRTIDNLPALQRIQQQAFATADRLFDWQERGTALRDWLARIVDRKASADFADI